MHPTGQTRDQLVVGDDGLDPRRLRDLEAPVPVLEQAGLAISAVRLGQLRDERELVRGRSVREAEPGERILDVTVGRGPRVVVGVGGHGPILEHQFDPCQDL